MKSWLATALIAAAAGQARAQAEPEIFGKPGRVLVSGSVSLQNVSSNAAGSKAVTALAVEPAINVFVAPNVALGFQLDIVAVGGGRTLTSVGLLPSVGYNFDLALGVSFVPQARFGFSSTSSSDPAPGSTVTRWSNGPTSTCARGCASSSASAPISSSIWRPPPAPAASRRARR